MTIRVEEHEEGQSSILVNKGRPTSRRDGPGGGGHGGGPGGGGRFESGRRGPREDGAPVSSDSAPDSEGES